MTSSNILYCICFCSQLLLLACLVLFSTQFHHSLLSVALGHFAMPTGLFFLRLFQLLTLKTQNFGICVYSVFSVSLHVNRLYLIFQPDQCGMPVLLHFLFSCLWYFFQQPSGHNFLTPMLFSTVMLAVVYHTICRPVFSPHIQKLL